MRSRCRELIALLTERNITIAVAESFTAGLASYLLVDEPGAGDVVLGSAVVYHATEKRRILGVSDGPVVSARCAIEMSAGVRRLFNATSAVAWTGVAGPDMQEGQPVGTVFVSSRLVSRARLQQHRYHGTPNQIRLQAILGGVSSLADMVDVKSSGSATWLPAMSSPPRPHPRPQPLEGMIRHATRSITVRQANDGARTEPRV